MLFCRVGRDECVCMNKTSSKFVNCSEHVLIRCFQGGQRGISTERKEYNSTYGFYLGLKADNKKVAVVLCYRSRGVDELLFVVIGTVLFDTYKTSA